MSFSSKTKDALLQRKIKSDSEYKLMLCAATTAIGTLSFNRGRGIGIKYITEYEPALRLCAKASEKNYDVESVMELHESLKFKSAKSTQLVIFGKDAEKLMYDAQLLTSEEYVPLIPQDEADCTAYLRGAFLACGTLSDPNKSLHLEITCKNKTAADMVLQAAEILGMSMKYSKRKDFHIAYIKDGEGISNFLSFIGADAAVLDFENIRIIRDSRNYANRTRNCDVANIDRASSAAMRQIEEIDFLLRHYDGELPDTLFEMAQMRLSHPEATLSDLAELMGIGKSGVNHRLQRRLQLAKELHDKENI